MNQNSPRGRVSWAELMYHTKIFLITSPGNSSRGPTRPLVSDFQDRKIDRNRGPNPLKLRFPPKSTMLNLMRWSVLFNFEVMDFSELNMQPPNIASSHSAQTKSLSFLYFDRSSI